MIKLLSLFSGIGAFERALTNLNIDFKTVNYCEIDKYASKPYSILHNIGKDKNLKDINTIDINKLKNKDINLITYGFPCQDISVAGKQKGLEFNGKTTRSGLVWKAHEIIKELQPNFAICENVKALTRKKFTNEFKAILDNLGKIGYNNYWQVLNAKDYGIPQNRERIFIVSIRKDIDNNTFKFPDKLELKICLKDLLEQDIDQKYYIKDDKIKNIKFSDNNLYTNYKQQKQIFNDFKVRKLTPAECFKLMGFNYEDAYILSKNGISNTQLYKQAGNSIVVDVLINIFKEMYKL